MQKPLCPWWRLQAIADAEVEGIAPNSRIIASVQHIDDATAWDDECEGLGRVRWFCSYIVPPDDPATRAMYRLSAMLNARSKFANCCSNCCPGPRSRLLAGETISLNL